MKRSAILAFCLVCALSVEAARVPLRQQDEDPDPSTDFSGSDTSRNTGRWTGSGGRVSGSANSDDANSNNGRRTFGEGDSNTNSGLFAPNENNFNRLTTPDPRLNPGSNSGRDSSSSSRDRNTDTSNRDRLIAVITSGDRDSAISNGGRGTSDRDISNRGTSDRFTSGGDRDSSVSSNGRGTSDRDISSDRSRGTSDRLTSSDNRDSSSSRDRTSDRLTGTSDRDISDSVGRGSGNFDRDTDSSFSRGRGTTRSSSQFPTNFRIDMQIIRLENKNGIIATGKSCDVLSSCDPKIYADIDTTGSSTWPKDPAYKSWPVVFQKTNDNSPVINVMFNRDVCGGNSDSQLTATLRARVVDADSVSSEDDIAKFDCIFPVRPRDVGTDPLTTPWGEQIECTGNTQGGKVKLIARERAYQISSSDCNSQRRILAIMAPKA